MKFFTFLFIIIPFGQLLSQNVYFPDPDFKSKLLESSTSNTIAKNLQGAYFAIDANGDAEIQVTEATQVSELDFSSNYYGQINSIVGIESFINLVYLDISFNSYLYEAQLTNFQHLTTVVVGGCRSLLKLIVTDNPLLTNIDFECSTCYPVFPDLDTLDCSGNNLSILDLISGSMNETPPLKYLDFSDNHISSFSFYGYYELDYLDISGNEFTDLTLTLSGLQYLYFNDNPLVNLDLNCSLNDTLNIINFPDLVSIDVSGCYGHRLKYLNLSDLPSLTVIDCSDNDFEHLILQNLPSLASFNIENMEMDLTLHNLPSITHLDFSKFYLLHNLYISELDNLLQIKSVYWDEVHLSDLVISDMENLNFADLALYTDGFSIANTPSLDTLLFNNYQLTNDLVFDGLTDLKYLKISATAKDSTIILNNLPSLDYLILNTGKEYLQIDNLPALSTVIINSFSLKALEISNLPDLYKLELINTYQINNLILTDIPLKVLKMYDNMSNGNSDWGPVSFGNLPELDSIYFRSVSMKSLDFNNLPVHVIDLNFVCLQDPLIFNDLPELNSLSIRWSEIDTLAITELEGLEDLIIHKIAGDVCLNYGNSLTSFEISDLPNLKYLAITENGINNTLGFNITNYPELHTLVYDQGNSLTIADLPSLRDLSVKSYFSDDTIQFSGFPSLRSFNLETNSDDIIHIISPVLEQLSVKMFQGEVDLSGCPSLDVLNLDFYYHLDYLNLKNGSSNLSSFQANDNINRICVDSQAEADLLTSFEPEYLSATTFTTNCPTNPCPINKITGTISYDPNNNNCQNTDIRCANTKLIISGDTNFETFTDSTGSFKYITQSLNNDIVITPVFEEPYFNAYPQSTTVSFSNYGNVQTTDFCVAPADAHNDVEIIFSTVQAPRPGFDLNCNIDFKNKGTSSANGTINLYHNDDVMDIVSVYPPNNSYTNNCVSWNYSDLNPFEMQNISVTFNLNTPGEVPPLNGGDILEFSAEITPVENDERPDDNTFTVNQEVVNSYDPNDKICQEGTALNIENVGDYVHYIIRFENTGNADAVNIVVRDVIDTTKFDINSFVFLNSSHSCEVKITGNNIEFSFSKINLSYLNDQNEGFINFKIKTLATLQLNDIFSNRAMIYFDFNAPIYTSNCETVVLLNVDTENIPLGDDNPIVFPNPVLDLLNISSKTPVTKVEIIDLNGRILHTYSGSNSIPMTHKPGGLYFVKVYTGLRIVVFKIIKV